MALSLRYRINEGIEFSENTGDDHQKSVAVIVRDITLFPEGVSVDFELRDLNGNSKLSLREGERYNVTPNCRLHLPKDPLRGSELSIDEDERVFLKFYASREVEFGERRIYPL